MSFASLCALVWCAHDEFMHVHGCIVSIFQSAWFGQKKKIAAALECAKHGKLFGAQKASVCGSDTILTVFREMCDNRPVQPFECVTPAPNRVCPVLPIHSKKLQKRLILVTWGGLLAALRAVRESISDNIFDTNLNT